jgi:hypothetical protein
MRLAASLLQDLGFMLYAGPIVAFSILIWLSPRISTLPIHAAVRTYRAWGPGLGLALGACILGGVWGHWQDTGDFSWECQTRVQCWTLATHGLFVVAWISNIVLEIWTLEPLRKLDTDSPAPPPDATAYAASALRLSRHMALHSLILMGVAVLEVSRRLL